MTRGLCLAIGHPRAGRTGNTDLWVDQVAMYGVLNVGGQAPGSAPNGVVSGSPITPAAFESAATNATPAVTAPAASRRRCRGLFSGRGNRWSSCRSLASTPFGWAGRRLTAKWPTPAVGDVHRLRTADAGANADLPLDGRFAQVMAWDLGDLTQPGDLELCHRWSQAIEYYESVPSRPVLLRPTGMTREASRIADLVMIGRPTLGSTISWPAYGAWLGQQRRLVRGGTPLWVNVETHCGSHFASQLGALRGSSAAIVPATFHDLTMATAAAFSVSPRGFCFQSQASLAGGEPENQIRGLALELTNLRLGLAEPWLAGGKSATVAHSSRPDLSGLVIKVDRSHLIVPMRWSDQALAPGGKRTRSRFRSNCPASRSRPTLTCSRSPDRNGCRPSG